MNYIKWFDPDRPASPVRAAGREMGDRTESVPYFYQPDITLAVNVAMATQRPLLVSGPSGCGKSTLAADIARVKGWAYEKEVITSRMQAMDLLYQVDHLRQLQDTRTGLREMAQYISPGVLWRAFDPDGAGKRRATDPASAIDLDRSKPPGPNGVVVLVDEIDKAEPDVPNNLLEPFGSYTFKVRELAVEVRALRTPLLVVTTNNERRLPDAFIRRCVDLRIELPKKDVLMKIAELHFAADLARYRQKVPGTSILELAADAVTGTNTYSTAEYLDTLRAIFNLQIAESKETFEALAARTVRKAAKAVGQ